MKKEINNNDHPLRFSKLSLMLFAGAFVSLFLGFALLIIGDIHIAPILLVLGYLILIPAAIIKK